MTYSARDMRDAFLLGTSLQSLGAPEAIAYAMRKWPDPLSPRTVKDVQENTMRLNGDQIEAIRPGKTEYETLYADLRNFPLISDLMRYPMQDAEGHPCTVNGERKPE